MSRPLSRLAFAVLVLAALCSTAVPAAAQPGKTPQLYVVHVERALPSKVADYESTTKEFIKLVQANRQTMGNFNFTAFQGEDLAYSYIAPIKSFADIDGVFASFEALGKAAGAQFGDLMRRSGATYTSVDESVFVSVPEASYWPAGAAVTPDNAAYYQFDFYRVIPGMEEEAAKIAASWKQLFESKNVPYGYSAFKLALGSDGPLWVISTPAKDPANLAAIEADSRKAIGEEAWRAQMMKTMAITRGMDSKRAWVRPDLSLPAPGK